MFGGLGVQELLIVFIIALILFGGKKLPEVGQNLGKALRSFRQAEEETRRELHKAVEEPGGKQEGHARAEEADAVEEPEGSGAEEMAAGVDGSGHKES